MIRVYPSKLNGTLKAPPSCVHAERLLFMAAMPAGAPTIVDNLPNADDIQTAIDCLLALNCKVEKHDGGSCTVTPFPKNTPAQIADFNFGKSSTISRIAIALSGAQGIRANCDGDKSLTRRDIFPLTSRMAIRGVRFSSFSMPFHTSGRLEPGEFVCEGDKGSQYISALLMALPVLIEESKIRLASPLADSSFVDLTIESLEKFGIEIHRTEDGFTIPGRQYYSSPDKVTVENDWGLAALWVAAGAAGGDGCGVTVTDLPANSPQIYREVAKEFPLISQDFIELDLDASSSPNLATFYAAMAAVKGATVTIGGVPQLKEKESDRLAVMEEICRTLGQDAEITADGIKVIGNSEAMFRPDILVDCKDDPWVFMSMVLASTKLTKPIILDNEHCADGIYKDFLMDFESLGGKFEILGENFELLEKHPYEPDEDLENPDEQSEENEVN